MKKSKVLVGLCPIGKFVFSNEDAVRYKKVVQHLLAEWSIDYVDLDNILEDGLVKDQRQVDIVVKHFNEHDVDCLFMPHCNFGTEGAVGMIGKKLSVPVLLWGPRDEAPLSDGKRLRDSLCGLFASSKTLNKLNVPFTYIENCYPEEEAFKSGVDNFVRAVNVADIFRKGVRIGLIGQRIDFFWTTIINESELLSRFNIEVLPIDMVEFINNSLDRVKSNADEYREQYEQISKDIVIEGFNDSQPIMNVLAVKDQMLELAERNNLDGIALQSFDSIVNACGSYCSLAECIVGDSLPIGAESDILGAISDMILRRASLNTAPAYLAEFTVRHPSNDNGILIWHEGAPLSLCHPDDKVRLGKHWILPSPLSGMSHFRLRDGNVTVVRFDGENGCYKIAVGEGRSIDGPYTLNNYMWMETDDWKRWERQLIEGPFIHHTAMAYGNYSDVVIEACKYIPGGVEPILLGK